MPKDCRRLYDAANYLDLKIITAKIKSYQTFAAETRSQKGGDDNDTSPITGKDGRAQVRIILPVADCDDRCSDPDNRDNVLGLYGFFANKPLRLLLLQS